MPIQNQSFAKNFLNRVRRFMKTKIRSADHILSVGRYAIKLPPEHLLPEYLNICDQYDRFVPALAGALNANSTVIDVGANCGDSLAFMINKNSNARYIAIEPDPDFFSYLEQNIVEIKSKNATAKILALQNMIGKSVAVADLSGKGGTKSAIVGSGRFKTISLDALCAAHDITHVDFIKSDVDGFDYDVIASATDIIERDKPLIFFECLINFPEQRISYDACISQLKAAGYSDWVVFDNFGHILLRTKEASDIRFFFDYTAKNMLIGHHMPFHYVDILAGVEIHADIISQALAEHEKAAQSANS